MFCGLVLPGCGAARRGDLCMGPADRCNAVHVSYEPTHTVMHRACAGGPGAILWDQ